MGRGLVLGLFVVCVCGKGEAAHRTHPWSPHPLLLGRLPLRRELVCGGDGWPGGEEEKKEKKKRGGGGGGGGRFSNKFEQFIQKEWERQALNLRPLEIPYSFLFSEKKNSQKQSHDSNRLARSTERSENPILPAL